MDQVFKEQQIEVAAAVLAAYATFFYTILVSLTQAGKTGGYHKVIQDMMRKHTIERAYILCGSNEKELRAQAIQDTKDYNPDLWAKKQIEVLFRQDFKKGGEYRKLNLVNALVVIEESHLDQDVGSELHKLLTHNRISLDGNPEALRKNNTFILSVSATPYSEIAAYTHKETPFTDHKRVIHMAPGEGYYGIAEYNRDRLIEYAYDITEYPNDFAKDIGNSGKMWSLVRLPSTGKKAVLLEKTIKQICQAHGYELLYYTSKFTDVAMTREEQETLKLEKCLCDAPNVPTVVILHGRLRAGKVVPKEFINLVWEGAEDSKTDSLIQGLPGRMCGYDLGDHKPRIFVPLPFLMRNIGKTCPHSELERAIDSHNLLPRHATNLKKASLANRTGNGRTPCVPIRLTLKNSDDEWLPHTASDVSDRSLGDYARGVLLANTHLIQDSSDLTDEQKKEILGFISDPKVYPHVRKSGQVSYYKALLEAYETKTAPPEHFSDFPKMGFVFWNPAFEGVVPRANKYHLYVVFLTDKPGKFDAINLKSRVSTTNGKTIFTNPFAVPENCVAIQPINIGAECVTTAKKMKETIHKCIWRWVEDENVQPFIVGNGGLLQVKKKAFHYKDGKSNDVWVVCRELEKEMEAELKFKLVIKPVFGRSGDDYFNVKQIRWDMKV